MSKYTTQVRFICESLAGYSDSQGYGKVSEIIDNSWEQIFDFDFPIFDANYKSVLCKKILKHYYTREIGLETYGLWKLKLDTKMNEIMPYYNKRYESASLQFNPLWDVDYTKVSNGDESGANSRESIGTSENKESTIRDSKRQIQEDGNVLKNYNSQIENNKGGEDTFETNRNGNENTVDRYSDTPQGGLVGMRNDNYLTRAEIINKDSESAGIDKTKYNSSDTSKRTGSDSDNSSKVGKENINDVGNVVNDGKTSESENGAFSTTKEYIEHVSGKMGGRSYAKAIMEYRDSLINVDAEIIDELGELFMKLW